MGPSIGELYFKNLAELRLAMENYRDQWVSFHCEDPEILESNKNQPNHFLKRPIEAEVMATKHALALMNEFNLTGKLCHYSSGEGLKLILEQKKKGLNVVCEVTPQHLYFSEEFIEEKQKTLMQMNPPIRTQKNSTEMLEAFKRGEIDFLATDHAPHSIEEKEKGMSGLTGLDTFASFVTWLIINAGVPPTLIAKTCSENPGRFFNEFLPSLKSQVNYYDDLGLGMGFLRPDYSASFTILNMTSPTVVTTDFLKTKCGHSPFLGAKFPGSLEALFLKGKIVSGKSKYFSV
jgi:dihydroorotase